MMAKKIYGIKEIGPFHAVRVALRLFLFWGKRQASPGQVSSPISDIAFAFTAAERLQIPQCGPERKKFTDRKALGWGLPFTP
jgi:hypothetical protein